MTEVIFKFRETEDTIYKCNKNNNIWSVEESK